VCRNGCSASDPYASGFNTYYGYVLPVHDLCQSGVATTPVGTAGSQNVTWTCNSTDGGASASCLGKKTSGGLCNYSYHGKVFTVQPDNALLCSVGTAVNVSLYKDNLRWECYEDGFANNSSCWSLKIVNGACGSSNGQSFSSLPTTGLCSSGGAYYKSMRVNKEEFEDPNNFYWVCEGQGGGTNAYCSATRSYPATSGKCGTSNGGTFSTAPTTNLCSQGTPTTVVDHVQAPSTTWFWMCIGDGGNDVGCRATKQGASADPACGTANFTSFSTVPADSELCGPNNYVYMIGGYMGYWSWWCYGKKSDGTIDSGRWKSCRGFKPTLTLTATDSCKVTQVDDAGLNSALCYDGYYVANSYGHTCHNEWQESTCFLYSPQTCSCGTANGVSIATAPTTGLCGGGYNSSYISSVTYSATDNEWHWICTGPSNGGYCDCSAPKMIDGVCGAAAGNYAEGDTSFAGTFCSSGNLFPVTTPTFPEAGATTNWFCQGINSGANVLCSANRAKNGVCGDAVRNFAYNEDGYGTYNQCSSGIASNTAFPEQGSSITWTCSGTNGGVASSDCTATRDSPPPDGICGASNAGKFDHPPTSDLCSQGSPSVVVLFNNTFVWFCTGGATATCSAMMNPNPLWIEK
jgi:hypothetical protein